MSIIKLKVLDRDGRTLAAAPPGESVTLVYGGCYQPGDWIALESDGTEMFCQIHLEDSMPPAVVYLPDGSLQYHIPPAEDRSNYSPKSFTGPVHVLQARVLEKAELQTRRNLALNPYDGHDSTGFFPHAKANIETRGEAVFAARNAIDGVFVNWSHGKWPYQSWGINQDPNAEFRLDFGRPVLVDELRLTLRADFPHDSWWEEGTVVFSDGSRETLRLEKAETPQAFPIEPRRVESLILKDLKKAPDLSPFPALTQLEVYGTEIFDKETI